MLQSLVATCAIYGGLAEGVKGGELHGWLLSECEPDEDGNGGSESDTAALDARIAELERRLDFALEKYGEIVHCSECKHYATNIHGSYCKKSVAILGNSDGFCAWAERREP